MDQSRISIGKTRIFSAMLTIASMSIGTMPSALAARFTDIPSGAYYEGAAEALVQSGALEDTTQLRPSDLATRAELVKLLVRLNALDQPNPATGSFNDVPKGSWYFPFFEAAAKAGWIRGDNNCHGATRPCTARPGSNVNRAEAAALLMRGFQLNETGVAPQFTDVSNDAWYRGIIQAAADHCILQGDSGTSTVRPGAFMNRAEMITMFHRASQHQEYSKNCGSTNAGIASVTVLSPTSLRITFQVNIDETRAEDEDRYTLTSTAGDIDVTTATMTDARKVELTLATALSNGASYTLRANSLSTTWGFIFTDEETFTTQGDSGSISQVTALSPSRVQVKFSVDLNRATAEEKARYSIELSAGGGTRTIDSVQWIDNRTVELRLGTGSLSSNTPYRLRVTGMRTSAGDTFSSSISFILTASSPTITGVTTLTPQRLRVTFNEAVDTGIAEEESRYSISGTGSAIRIGTATRTDGTTVELSLLDALSAQRPYTLTVNNLRSEAGTLFSMSQSFVAGQDTQRFYALLRGGDEVPAVSTTATGSGSFTLQSDGLHYDITVRMMTGSTITGAHFHRAGVGANGPVVFPITFNGNRATGVWTGISSSDRSALFSESIYFNVHTTQYPNGEIRGQLRLGNPPTM